MHKLHDALVATSFVPHVSRDHEVVLTYLEVDVWHLLVLFLGALAVHQGVEHCVALLAFQEHVRDGIEVIVWDHIERGSRVSHHNVNGGSEGSVAKSDSVEVHLPKHWTADLVPINLGTLLCILFEVIPANVDFARLWLGLIYEKSKLTILNSAMFVQGGNKQLGISHLGRGRQTNKSSTCESTKLFLVDHRLEQVVFHATVTDLAILLQTDLVR